jgi:tetratricopeptide (TPR) repeat protein
MKDLAYYQKVCFIIMPFGKKPPNPKKPKVLVDFDHIYGNVFEPAIAEVDLPEGGKLIPRRADKDFYAGDISQDMFEYLEYSRFAVADISGLNFNVAYELGVRHRARSAGTAIFRQVQIEGAPPFDISQIRTFPYEYNPKKKALKSREIIRQVLNESLAQNRIDSPVQRALIVQREQQENTKVDIEGVLREAENALRHQDRAGAILKYHEAIKVSPKNLLALLKLGLLLKEQGSWTGALEQFDKAIAASPNYAEARREKGIAENKLFYKNGAPLTLPTGEDSLRRAVALNEDDFDALSSLGGVLKRQKRYDEAIKAYARASEVSNRHTYPLLNLLTLEARGKGQFKIDEELALHLERAARSLKVQVNSEPPYNPPWSAFDLAQVHLFLRDKTNFLKYLREGIIASTDDWMPNTFRETLELLVEGNVKLPGLKEGIESLKKAKVTPKESA